jgi:hypothetical protein
MISGMLYSNRGELAARCVIVCLAGFPSGPLALPTRAATEVSLPDQSTPEPKIRIYGFPWLRELPLVSLHEFGASKEPASTPLKFELREQYQIVVPGAIGLLKRLNLLIDTGSIPSMVDRRVAKKLGLDVRESEIVAFGKKSHVLTTVLPSIILGPLRADAVTSGVGDLSFLHGVDAIIGLDVLSRSSFSIDYEAQQLTFGSLVAREPTVRLEITPPFLTVQLTLGGRPVRLLVDTGSRRLVLFEHRVNDRLPRLRHHGEQLLYHISGISRLDRVFLPPLDAGGSTIEHVEGFMSNAPVDNYPPQIDGVLGIRVLALEGAEFDFERSRFGFR